MMFWEQGFRGWQYLSIQVYSLIIVTVEHHVRRVVHIPHYHIHHLSVWTRTMALSDAAPASSTLLLTLLTSAALVVALDMLFN